MPVTCLNCGAEIPRELYQLPDEPCKACGVVKRRITIQAITGVVHLELPSPRIEFRGFVNRLPTITLLFDFVELGTKVNEGTLVKAVAPAWWRLLSVLEQNPSEIFKLPHRKFEELVAAAYYAEGCDVILTPRSGDGGVDVIAEFPGLFKFRIYDQAKLYKPGHLVTADEVRSLIATTNPVGQNKGASMGVVTTTSKFAPRIESDPTIAAHLPHHLTLIDGDQLFQRLKQIKSKKSGID